jgi:hypothetical protein
LEESIEAGSELLVFSDAEALRALEVISRRRPDIVVVERGFAKTPRGAALLNRITADPTLSKSVVRVVAPGSANDPKDAERAVVAPAVSAGPLDQRGTRRMPRFRMASRVEIVADGNIATIIDLSTIGAQIVSSVILKPNQKLRMILADDQGTVRCSALVAWASFEIPAKSDPHYRAGVEFIDADSDAVSAFCRRHRVDEP